MKLESGFENRRGRLEMVSLMDVMFLILAFFIYSIFSMTVHHGLRVNLPGGTGETQREEPVVVSIAADGTLALNRRMFPDEDALVEAILKMGSADTSVLIAADRDSKLGLGISLLEKMQRSGISKVAFQVDRKKP